MNFKIGDICRINKKYKAKHRQNRLVKIVDIGLTSFPFRGRFLFEDVYNSFTKDDIFRMDQLDLVTNGLRLIKERHNLNKSST